MRTVCGNDVANVGPCLSLLTLTFARRLVTTAELNDDSFMRPTQHHVLLAVSLKSRPRLQMSDFRR